MDQPPSEDATVASVEESGPETSSVGFFPLDDVERQTNCVVIDWMEPLDIAGYWVLCAFFCVCAGLLVFSGWEDYVGAVHSPWLSVVFPFLFISIALAISVMFLRPAYARRKRAVQAAARARTAKHPTQIPADDAHALLADALCRALIRRAVNVGPLPKLPLIYFQMAQHKLAVPRIILDRRIADAVLAIERPGHLLEPESIDSHGSRWRESLSWLAVAAGVFVCWYLARSTFVLVAFIALSGSAFVASLIRWMRTGVSPGDSGFLAGVGYLEGPDGARVPSAHVVTVVSSSHFQQMRVRLLAPTWNLELRFPSPRDPGFITFWQRWNHPHPRPELLDH